MSRLSGRAPAARITARSPSARLSPADPAAALQPVAPTPELAVRAAQAATTAGAALGIGATLPGASPGDCPLVIGPTDDAPVTQPRIWLKTTETPGDVAVILRMP